MLQAIYVDSRLSKRKEEKLSDNNELFVDEWSGSEYELDENGLVQNLRPSNEINYNKFDNEDIKLNIMKLAQNNKYSSKIFCV